MNNYLSRSLKPDEIIFLQGETGDCAYLIEQGRVLIFLEKDGTEVPLKVLNKGEVFGEMSLIDGSPRSASCRSIDHGILLRVTKTQLTDRISAADPVVRLLMQALLDRLRSQNQRLVGNSASNSINLESFSEINKEARQRIELENRIANALQEDEFCPYYQPIYDLNTGEVAGCEALMRWIGKDGKIVSPAIFMDVMESSSLIIQAGKVMLEKSARDLPKLRTHFSGSPDFFVSVNVSGRQFMEKDFIENLEAIRSLAKIDAAHVKLELTERIMTEGAVAISTLKNCRELGYQLAIDDFGTGFSSLQYLAQMPITHLKIDRCFVTSLFKDDKSLLIVKSLIHMAGVLGLKLIAEGIETKEQLELLKGLNVGMGQGFLFAKPISLKEFLTFPSTVSNVATSSLEKFV